MLFSSCIPSRARTCFSATKCPDQLWAHPFSHSVHTERPFSEGGLRCRSVKLTILRNLIPKFKNALRWTPIAPPPIQFHGMMFIAAPDDCSCSTKQHTM